MSTLADIIGFLMAYGLIAWWAWSAWVTGKAVGHVVSAPFAKEKQPVKQQDPVQNTAKKRKKLVYTMDEAKYALEVSVGILKSYIASGEIRTYRDGDKLFLDGDDVIKLMNKPPKRVFPVLDDYNDDHKITNPVEFDD
tara:strand:+ start:14 stop:427 length:414 start_codon:yes stop_codon:yes gene_type:complete